VLQARDLGTEIDVGTVILADSVQQARGFDVCDPAWRPDRAERPRAGVCGWGSDWLDTHLVRREF